jgi:hypothetical protein
MTFDRSSTMGLPAMETAPTTQATMPRAQTFPDLAMFNCAQYALPSAYGNLPYMPSLGSGSALGKTITSGSSTTSRRYSSISAHGSFGSDAPYLRQSGGGYRATLTPLELLMAQQQNSDTNRPVTLRVSTL